MGFEPKRSVFPPNLRGYEKALIIRLKLGKDIFDLLQIARVEGRKVLKCDKVRVPEFFHSRLDPEKYVVVVQNADVGMRNMKSK